MISEKFKRLLRKNNCLNAAYDDEVRARIRKKYDQDDVEAILNNYLAEPENPKYLEEFTALQAYRAQCKAEVKAELYGN